MKSFLLSTLGASALVLAACVGEDSAQSEDPGVKAPAPIGEGPGSTPAPGGEEPEMERIGFRMKSDKMPDYITQMEVSVADVKAYYYDGLVPVPATVEMVDDSVDLEDEDHAPLVAYVYMPNTVTEAYVTVALGDKSFTRAGLQEVEVDASGALMTFEAPMKEVILRHHMVLELDMERSLKQIEATKMQLLPNGNVRY